MRDVIQGSRNKHPGLVDRLLSDSDSDEAKDLLIKAGALREGPLPVVPMKLRPLMVEAVNVTLTKLTKALYYRDSASIVASDAWVGVRWWTNANALTKTIPDVVGPLPRVKPEVKRDKIDLSDQFSCWYSSVPEVDLAVSRVAFGFSFVGIGLVTTNANTRRQIEGNLEE